MFVFLQLVITISIVLSSLFFSPVFISFSSNTFLFGESMFVAKKTFIDIPLEEHENTFVSVLVAVDILTSQTNFFFFFLHAENKSAELFSTLRTILPDMSNEDFDQFQDMLEMSTTSFSWGYNDLECIFIIFSKEDEHVIFDPPALIGLLIHEMIHGLERQRGLEDDLKRSLHFSLQLFEGLASLIPGYPEGQVVQMLHAVEDIALYTLKDIYVNREALERGHGTEILAYYQALFNIDEEEEPHVKDQKFSLGLDIQLVKDPSTHCYNLQDFQEAFSVLLSVIPTWLPFFRLGGSYEKIQAQAIEKHLRLSYQNLRPLGRYLDNLANIYLTDFSFTTDFHQRYFSEIFSILVNFLTDGGFIIWQLTQIIEAVESLLEQVSDANTHSILRDTVLEPVLKASYIRAHNSSDWANLKPNIIDKMQHYMDNDDFEEWKLDWKEYKVEDLLLFSVDQLVPLIREKFLDELVTLRPYTRLVVELLQILIDLGEELKYHQEYIYIKEQIYSFITQRDSRFLSLKIIYPLEFYLHQLIFNDSTLFSPDQAKEFLMLFRFFAIPKDNLYLVLGDKFAKMIKMNLDNAKTKNQEPDQTVMSLTLLTLISSLDEDELKYIVPLVRATLMALGQPIPLIRSTVQVFGDLVKNMLLDKETAEQPASDKPAGVPEPSSAKKIHIATKNTSIKKSTKKKSTSKTS